MAVAGLRAMGGINPMSEIDETGIPVISNVDVSGALVTSLGTTRTLAEWMEGLSPLGTLTIANIVVSGDINADNIVVNTITAGNFEATSGNFGSINADVAVIATLNAVDTTGTSSSVQTAEANTFSAFTAMEIAGVPVVTTTGSQTLTNKTLTNPTINGATLTGSITGGTFTGGTYSGTLVTTGVVSLGMTSGGVINFNSGDVTITHSANVLAFAGASSGYNFDANVLVSSLSSGGALSGTTITLSGGQIVFPSSASPSANVNTLDDYEEGTFTPAMRVNSSGTGITFITRTGSYTKIGNVCTVNMVFLLSNNGANTGLVEIISLPFGAAEDTSLSVIANSGFTGVSAGVTALLQATTVTLFTPSASGSTQLTDTNVTNAASFVVSGSYRTT